MRVPGNRSFGGSVLKGAVSVCLLVLSSALGCATVKPVSARSTEALHSANPKGTISPITLEHEVISQHSAASVSELSARGMLRLELREWGAAEEEFAWCVRVEPDGPNAAFCLYHGAIASDELGKFDQALAKLMVLANQFPDHDWALPGTLRALRLAVHLERWKDADALAQRLLAQRSRLKPFELVLPYGAAAMSAVLRNDDVTAEQLVARARSVIDSSELDVPGKIHRDLAVVYFALAEIRRLRAERITFADGVDGFAERLEQRCQLILDAQSAYSDSMRAHDSHWSTMAGYRVGELYAKLHQELMQMVARREVDGSERRSLFEGAMRMRYSVLITKALQMIEHTLDMAARVGEVSPWVERAKSIRAELKKQQRIEEEAIGRLPYSREALLYAISHLSEAAKADGQATQSRRGTAPAQSP